MSGGIKTLALDISTTAIGWACGEWREEYIRITGDSRDAITLEAKQRIDFGEEKRHKVEGETEADIFHSCYIIVMGIWIANDKPQRILMEESNSSMNMHTTRLLLGLRGILIHAFYNADIQVELLSVSSVRSRTGISTGCKKGTTKYMRRKIVKQRCIDKCHELGYDVKSDDAADAVLLLLAGE